MCIIIPSINYGKIGFNIVYIFVVVIVVNANICSDVIALISSKKRVKNDEACSHFSYLADFPSRNIHMIPENVLYLAFKLLWNEKKNEESEKNGVSRLKIQIKQEESHRNSYQAIYYSIFYMPL